MPQQNLKALQSKILQKAEMTTNIEDKGKKKKPGCRDDAS